MSLGGNEETLQPGEGLYNGDSTRKTARGRPKTSWMNNITARTGLTANVRCYIEEDRGKK